MGREFTSRIDETDWTLDTSTYDGTLCGQKAFGAFGFLSERHSVTDSDPLTFHVVFVAGTVRDLRVFIPSLLTWGRDCRFRLVSNGCSPADDALLRQLEQISPRVEFYRLPGQHTWTHGAALSHLQQRETGSRFAFLDSDIFATGDFLGDLESQTGTVAALFSCTPLWGCGYPPTVPRGFRIANCPYYQFENDFCIGSTYFAIYDNRVLTDCLAAYSITMNQYLFHEIPVAVRERLVNEGRDMLFYDPAKLVNILLNLDGHACRFSKSQYLHHLGGVSTFQLFLTKSFYARIRSYCVSLIPRSVWRFADWAGVKRNWRWRLSSQEIRQLTVKGNLKRSTSNFFFQVLRSCQNGQRFDGDFDSGNPELDNEIRVAGGLICQLYPTWQAWLDGRDQLPTPSMVPDVVPAGQAVPDRSGTT